MNADTQEQMDLAAAAPERVDDLATVEGILAAIDGHACRFLLDASGCLQRDAQGAARFQGNSPTALLAAIRARKHEVLSAYEARSLAARSRWCQAPEEALPLQLHRRLPKSPLLDRLLDYVIRQLSATLPRDVALANWLQTRRELYLAQSLPDADCDARAALDLVCWQRQVEAKEALLFLDGLADACPKHTP